MHDSGTHHGTLPPEGEPPANHAAPPNGLVSVIMPAFNAERYIPHAIESVRAQTYPLWELIVVDDGSTDHTAKMVSEAQRSEPRIKYVHQPNRGQGVAKNTGIKAAEGAFVAFLDSDDLWMPEKLERQIRAFEQTGADLVYTDGIIFVGEDPNSAAETFSVPSGLLSGRDLLNQLFLRNIVPILSAMVRTATLRKVPLFDEHGLTSTCCEDYDLWLKLAANGAVFCGLAQPLVKYRRHGASTSANIVRMAEAEMEVLQRHIHGVTLSRRQLAGRFRRLYRGLISHFLAQNEISEAWRRARSSSYWDSVWPATFVYLVLKSRLAARP